MEIIAAQVNIKVVIRFEDLNKFTEVLQMDTNLFLAFVKNVVVATVVEVAATNVDTIMEAVATMEQAIARPQVADELSFVENMAKRATNSKFIDEDMVSFMGKAVIHNFLAKEDFDFKDDLLLHYHILQIFVPQSYPSLSQDDVTSSD